MEIINFVGLVNTPPLKLFLIFRSTFYFDAFEQQCNTNDCDLIIKYFRLNF